MSKPKVSVIMPTYNRVRYLSEAIQSVLDQTFVDFELIIIDDGSTDDTESLIQGIGDPRIRYAHQQHRGISAAMNHGIRLARGHYIARLDSDDVWLPEMLATQIKVLDTRPRIGLVYSKAQAMNASGTPLEETRAFSPRYADDSFRSMLTGDFTCNITIVVRRQYLDKAGPYDESMAVNEDWDMWLRVAEHCQFAFSDLVLARYRRHDSNATGYNSRHYFQHLAGRKRVLDKVFSRRNLAAEVVAIKSVAYCNLHLWSGSCWLGVRSFRKALVSFFRALQTSKERVTTLRQILGLILHIAFRESRHYLNLKTKLKGI